MRRTAELPEPSGSSLMQGTVLLVLLTESVLFGVLVMAYLFLRGGGSSIAFTHPAAQDAMIAGLNTLVLLGSAWAARRAHQGIVRGDAGSLKLNLLAAFALGAVFVAGQIFEFRHSGMSLRAFGYGGIFFALISFHAAHVLAGMLVLALNIARAQAGDFTAKRHVGITAGTWFWYFVVAVWLVLFSVLYLI